MSDTSSDYELVDSSKNMFELETEYGLLPFEGVDDTDVETDGVETPVKTPVDASVNEPDTESNVESDVETNVDKTPNKTDDNISFEFYCFGKLVEKVENGYFWSRSEITNHERENELAVKTIIQNKTYNDLLKITSFSKSILSHDLFSDPNLSDSVVIHIIENISFLDACDSNGWELIHFVCRYCRPPVIMHMISIREKKPYALNLDGQTDDGHMPVHLLAIHQVVNSDMVEILTKFVENGVDLDLYNNADLPMLYYLCKEHYGNYNLDDSFCDIIDLYLKNGFDIDVEFNGRTFFEHLCENGSAPNTIIKVFNIIMSKDPHDERPFQYVLMYGSYQLITNIIYEFNYCADFNVKTKINENWGLTNKERNSIIKLIQ